MSSALATNLADSPVARRFLIVDDSRAIQAIIRRVVQTAGYSALDVRVASNGDDALKVAEDFNPELVITDWHMPRMSGLEMFQCMRQMGMGATKVGFITTESSEDLLRQARNNGAVFILRKPFRDDELVREIIAAVPVHAAASAAVPVEAPRLVQTEALRELVQRTLGEIPFRLLEHKGLDVSELTPQNMLGLYRGGGRAIAAVAVLDIKAVCILGGGAGAQQPAVVRGAMASGTPTEQMLQLATRFMGQTAALLDIGGPAEAPTLQTISVVPQSFSKLGEVLVREHRRADFRVSVPGYGDGRLSFIAM